MEKAEKFLCIIVFAVKELLFMGAFWVCMYIIFGFTIPEHPILWASIATAIAFVFVCWLGVREWKKYDELKSH